ncbi:MAG: hypothetical protein AAB466_04790 [Verrucomicrobiota bacterium]
MVGAVLAQPLARAEGNAAAGASGFQSGFGAEGAMDGNRFSLAAHHTWKGRSSESNWWWQIRFPGPSELGAILQIQGDHEFVFRNAPARYVWQYSLEGEGWRDLSETQVNQEQRLFRLHRLAQRRRVQFLRLQISAAEGDFPTLREIEFYGDPREKISFPDWFIVVNTTHERTLPNHGQEFIPLVKSCPGWEQLQAQQVWLSTFDETFCAAEPRPLCAFLSGNFKDWCEVEREPWRGTQAVLKAGHLPLWASCGGAQGLAILAETGVDKPWDCPHCRDPQNPKLPIYTHIGHTGQRPCGDYSACLFERGPFTVHQAVRDPAFEGLPGDFQVRESHCGQIEWPPAGWDLIVAGGPGTRTKTQCLRVKDRYIYAAQFHIEMPGTPETSRAIMGNFLSLAKRWGGYNPQGKPVAASSNWPE